MKSFKEYLTESKKVYEFKVKIAGDCPKDCSAKIKEALAQFSVASCSGGKSTPIQESNVDFPELKNIGMTVFDVCTHYPATSLQVRDAVSASLKKTLSEIRVRNLAEEKEMEINAEHSEKSGEALLGKDYEKDGDQKEVGTAHTENFLKELSKTKHTMTQYTGVNDQLTPTKPPKASDVKEQPVNKKALSTIGGKKVKLPTAQGVK
jgi:hypothetical protein